MKSPREIEAGARPGRPFSTSAEFALWEHLVCLGSGALGRRCTRARGENPCPLVVVAQARDCTPAAWRVGARPSCTEYQTNPGAFVPPEERWRLADEAEERAALEREHHGSLLDLEEGSSER